MANVNGRRNHAKLALSHPTSDEAMKPAAPQPTELPTLSAKFREKIRPVLNSIDRLRSHGLQSELRLPTVAVVGDQSVGKSSVLEAISGVDLPRGTGIVTRCPLQLSMRSRLEGQWRGQICYTNGSDKRIEHEIDDKTKVNEYVRKAQDDITGSTTGVSKQQIDLTIESSDVSDLTLIDLPGIARYSEKNRNISDTTKDLIKSYIAQEQVIILVVVPCHVDIETVEAIALAKEVDPTGRRTIGVMTCPDLTNPGSEDDVIATLRNEGRVRLHKGFVMVRCRSPKELNDNISLQEAGELEAQFFATHRQFSRISSDLLGTKTLADKLTDELFRAVAKSMDGMTANIKLKLSEYDTELKQLGDSLCESEDDKRHYLMRKLCEFVEKIKTVTASNSGATCRNSPLYGALLRQCFQFGQKMNSIKPDWIKINSLPVPADVEDEVRELRGRELPTFTFVFPIVEKIVRDRYLPQVDVHSCRLLERVHSEVSKTLVEISRVCFFAFPRLHEVVTDAATRITDAKEAQCRADLDKLIVHEGRMFTQDSLYEDIYRVAEKRRKEELDLHVHSLAQQVAFATGHRQTIRAPPVRTPQQQLEDSILERVRLGACAYLTVASQRISDTVPMSILSHMLDGVAAALELEMTGIFGKGERLLELLQETPDRSRRRKHLVESVEQMRQSQAEMLRAKRIRLDD